MSNAPTPDNTPVGAWLTHHQLASCKELFFQSGIHLLKDVSSLPASRLATLCPVESDLPLLTTKVATLSEPVNQFLCLATKFEEVQTMLGVDGKPPSSLSPKGTKGRTFSTRDRDRSSMPIVSPLKIGSRSQLETDQHTGNDEIVATGTTLSVPSLTLSAATPKTHSAAPNPSSGNLTTPSPSASGSASTSTASPQAASTAPKSMFSRKKWTELESASLPKEKTRSFEKGKRTDVGKVLQECLEYNEEIGKLLDSCTPGLEYQHIHKQMNATLFHYIALQNDLAMRAQAYREALKNFNEVVVAICDRTPNSGDVDDHLTTTTTTSTTSTSAAPTPVSSPGVGKKNAKKALTDRSKRSPRASLLDTREEPSGSLASAHSSSLLLVPDVDSPAPTPSGSGKSSTMSKRKKHLREPLDILNPDETGSRPTLKRSVTGDKHPGEKEKGGGCSGSEGGETPVLPSKKSREPTLPTTEEGKITEAENKAEGGSESKGSGGESVKTPQENINHNSNNNNTTGNNNITINNNKSPAKGSRKGGAGTEERAMPVSKQAGILPTFPPPRRDYEWDEDDDGDQRVLLSTSELCDLTAGVKQVYSAFLNISKEYHTAVEDVVVATKQSIEIVLKAKLLYDCWEKNFPEEGFLVPMDTFLNTLLDSSSTADDKRYVSTIIDPYGFGCVSPLTFKRFLRIFGNLDRMPKKVKDLCREQYFQGYWEEKSVRQLLLGEEVGTFLVHLLPGRPDRLALAHVTKNGIAQNRIVFTREGQVRVDESCSLHDLSQAPANDGANISMSSPLPLPSHGDGDRLYSKSFPTLQELIKTHAERFSWKVYDNRLTKGVYFLSGVSGANAKQKVLSTHPGTAIVFLSDKKNSFLEAVYHRFPTEPDYLQHRTGTIHIDRVPKGLQIRGAKPHIPLPSKIYSKLEDLVEDTPFLCYNFSPINLPTVSLLPYQSLPKLVLAGPTHPSDPCTVLDDELEICCRTIATYPANSAGAEVLCDAFQVQRSGNRITMVLCDGCNWGQRPRDAAQTAAAHFCNYFSDDIHRNVLTESNSLRGYLEWVLLSCHKAIIGEKKAEHVFTVGTTTLCGGVIVKLKSQRDLWGFICFSIGDCKAFRYSPADKSLLDITWGNRANARDATDCGGRIGPYLGRKGDPDFRNKAFYFTPCREGDYIFIVSDGIYDNFDPEHLAIEPNQLVKNGLQVEDQEFLKQLTEADGWGELTLAACTKAKEDFIQQKIQAKIVELGGNLSPKTLTQSLLDYAYDKTKNSRQYMEANPNSPEPTDYYLYPGKMDHTTCVCVKIQNLESSSYSAPSTAVSLSHSDSRSESDVPTPLPTDQQRAGSRLTNTSSSDTTKASRGTKKGIFNWKGGK